MAEIFHPARAQWPGRNYTGHSDFPRREGNNQAKEAAPVNGVPRGVVTMGAGAHRNQPLGVFWFLFHGEKELVPQGETL